MILVYIYLNFLQIFFLTTRCHCLLLVERRVSLHVRLLHRGLKRERHLYTAHLKLFTHLRPVWIQISVMLRVIVSRLELYYFLNRLSLLLQALPSSHYFSFFLSLPVSITLTNCSFGPQAGVWSGACRPRQLRRDH